jgi:hypothetical protein
VARRRAQDLKSGIPHFQCSGLAESRQGGHDPVSWLGFIKVEGGVVAKSMEWVADVGASASATLQAM